VSSRVDGRLLLRTSSVSLQSSNGPASTTAFAQPSLSNISFTGTGKNPWKPQLKIKAKSGFGGTVRSIITPSSIENKLMQNVYKDITKNADIMSIWEHCGMPDRFTSWVWLIYLHIWLYSMALEQYEGSKKCRNLLIRYMWNDIEDRRRLLKTATYWRKADLKNLNEVFRNFFVHMDIGYLQSDLDLASAIYKWMLNNHHKGLDGKPEKGKTLSVANTHVDITPEQTIQAVDFLVKYIRYHAKHLSELKPEDLLLEDQVFNNNEDAKLSSIWRPVKFFQLNQK